MYVMEPNNNSTSWNQTKLIADPWNPGIVALPHQLSQKAPRLFNPVFFYLYVLISIV